MSTLCRSGVLPLVCCLAFAAAFAGPPGETQHPAATVELRGLLIPVEMANLSSRSPGVIKMIKNEGDTVHAGEVVCQMEDDAERLSVEAQRAILAKRQFEADSATKLHDTHAASEDDSRTAQTNLETAKIQLKEAEFLLEKKSMRSPIDGIVTKRVRTVGEAVDQYFPVLYVVNPAKVWLEAYVPANRVRDVHPAQPVEVSVPDLLPDRTFTGQIDFISPTIDAASGEFRVKILVANTGDGSLRPGMSAIGVLTPIMESPSLGHK